jgi:hypothetical protein
LSSHFTPQLRYFLFLNLQFKHGQACRVQQLTVTQQLTLEQRTARPMNTVEEHDTQPPVVQLAC